MTSYTQTDGNSNCLSRELNEIFTEVEEKSRKYRDIPIKKFDDLIHWENMPGLKESKSKALQCHPENMSIVEVKGHTGTNKKRPKPDSLIPINRYQFKPFPDISFPDRARQSSISEPSLGVTKDRGDNVVQSFYREDNIFARNYSADKKSGNLKDHGISGCIYIKHNGKTFKSLIDANNLVEDDISFNVPRVRSVKSGKNRKPTDGSLSKHKLNDDFGTFETNGLQFSKEGIGDFEIAIFLSGVNCFSEKSAGKVRRPFSSQQKGTENNKEPEKKRNLRKKIIRKNDSIGTFGNNLKMVPLKYKTPPKTVTLYQNKANKIYGSEREPFNKSKTLRMPRCITNKSYVIERDQNGISVTPSDSDSESFSDIFDKIPQTSKRFKNVRPKIWSVKGVTYNDQEVKCSRKSKNDAASRSRLLSQSSLYQFSDVYRILPKMKVTDEELWEKFEAIFRSYASTSRHSWEVIPRKISTEWLTNAGVVDEIMTEKEADDAFRRAAGAKITMNAQEYKEFLIMLTLRMKLPYYEIYRRMCGI